MNEWIGGDLEIKVGGVFNFVRRFVSFVYAFYVVL